MGHELAHAFNRNGSEWALSYQREPLFGNGASSSFHSAYPCLIEQYSGFCPLAGTNYSVQCVDGSKTADENWADAVGIRLAYNAYEQRLNVSGKSIDEAVSQGELTYAQKFFAELTAEWCTRISEEKMSQHLVSTDEHCPKNYRVLGMLRNFPEFASAFGCSNLGSEGWCKLWGAHGTAESRK